jgi:hypothetical protein
MFTRQANEGFENDVIHDFGFLTVKAGVSFKI